MAHRLKKMPAKKPAQKGPKSGSQASLGSRLPLLSQGVYDVGGAATAVWKRKKALEERNAIRHELIKHHHRQQLAGELDRLQGYTRRLDQHSQDRLAALRQYLGPGHAGSAAPPPLHPML
jgi:hypothetical protein